MSWQFLFSLSSKAYSLGSRMDFAGNAANSTGGVVMLRDKGKTLYMRKSINQALSKIWEYRKRQASTT